MLTQPQLVYESADLMAKSYYKDASGHVGTQTLGVWKGYVGFLFARGVLTDARRQQADARARLRRRTSRTRTCRAQG